jgi:hypothetical protein
MEHFTLRVANDRKIRFFAPLDFRMGADCF